MIKVFQTFVASCYWTAHLVQKVLIEFFKWFIVLEYTRRTALTAPVINKHNQRYEKCCLSGFSFTLLAIDRYANNGHCKLFHGKLIAQWNKGKSSAAKQPPLLNIDYTLEACLDTLLLVSCGIHKCFSTCTTFPKEWRTTIDSQNHTGSILHAFEIALAHNIK